MSAKFLDYTGDLLESKAQALVNAVNCRGVMGGGIARQFKIKYPSMFAEYARVCNSGLLSPGNIHVWRDRGSGQYVFNFPTKLDWRNDGKYEYISSGMIDTVRLIKLYKIESIAIPRLGCGLGGLNWKKVLPIIYDTLRDVDGLLVMLYHK